MNAHGLIGRVGRAYGRRVGTPHDSPMSVGPWTRGHHRPDPVSGVKLAVLLVIILAISDAAAGREIVLAPLLTLGPCLAATSGSRRNVVAIGAFALACILLVSWPDHMWNTVPQLLYILAVVGVTAVSAFIAERSQQREAQATLAEERLAGAFESVGIGLALLQPSTATRKGSDEGTTAETASNLLAVNTTLASMFDWGRGPPPEALSRLLADATDHRTEHEVRVGDERVLHLRLVSTPLSTGNSRQRIHLVQIEDVSAQRLAEQRVVHVTELREQSNRLESLGQLAGGVAHDFNNLLAVILNYSAFVREELTKAIVAGGQIWEPVKQDVEQVERAGERAAELTHQLLAFARRDVVRPQILALNDIVGDMEQLLRRTLGKHIVLSVAGADDLWLITADAGQLEQVLVNLAVNSQDAMPTGGTLAIDTANVEVDQDYVSGHPGLSPGRYVRLRVSDTGTGMDPAVVRHAFEPFFTTKPKGEGTGLGLATIYGIVTQCGGRAQIYSELGIGTTFTALFPAADQSVTRSPRERVGAEGSGGTETILIVEDETAVRDVAERILLRGGYRVLSAANGLEALEIVGLNEDRIDLLLTDVVMPKMGGREVAARVRAIRPSMRVLFMSGYAEAVLGPRGTLDPGVLLVEKPFTSPVLLARVREALGAAAGDSPTQWQ
jgi:signal transduction histidine kinase/CheY-like chemotaxis protein